MPSLSYVLSSVALITPFIAAAILESTLKDHNYGEWLAVGLLFVFGFSLIRLLYKELTISEVLEASKKFKMRKGVKFLDTKFGPQGGTSFLGFLKKFLNSPGYVLSFILFPSSDIAFYLGLITLVVTFAISGYISVDNYGDLEAKTVIGILIPVVLVLFVGLRHLSDSKDLNQI